MKVICIANQKGGVAKTATTAIMASALTKRGNKVLAVDMDPQGNLSKQVGAEDNGRGVYSVLRGDIAIQDAIQHFDRFDILPTNILLAGLEGELVSEIGRSFRLKNALKDSAVRDVYDYVLIDTSGDAYNMICEFLGANWYALVATAGLAALAVLHIVYAFWLTMQNRKARGNERYAVTTRPQGVEWASQNMLVLGIIIILGLLLHLFNFWYNMMFAELTGIAVAHHPADGYAYIVDTFSCPVYVVLYIVWLVALWFHLTHGFWSAMQTFGWNGKVWYCRWKVIGIAYSTLLCLGFLVVVLWFAAKGLCGCC